MQIHAYYMVFTDNCAVLLVNHSINVLCISHSLQYNLAFGTDNFGNYADIYL